MTIEYKDSKRIVGLSTDRTGIESSQGYAGGDCSANAKSGGGGAGAVGNPQASGNIGGNGGAGLSSSITGSAVTRAGGGGGASWSSSTNSSGGTGGGGAGSQNAGTAGTVNTGSGGGGGGESGGNKTGGNGGSGIVILRFTTSGNGYDTPTGTHSVATDGSYTVISWTAGSGTFTPTSSYDVEYLVIAGGGGGGGGLGGGGGAGGYRTATGFGVTAQAYTITVGAGGAGAVANGSKGGDSVFSTITSEGGGLGTGEAGGNGGDGGSGGGTGTNGGSGGTSATYVSTPATIPTNVQDNFILVEKDTGRRYWFDDSFDKTGLKAYYKFNETSPSDIVNQAGTVGSVDGLGTGADIQITGATYGATGKIGDALSFDGTNDFGQIGTSLSQFNFLHSTTAKWTICFWMKLNATSRGTFDRIFNTTVSSGSAGINIYINDLSSTQKMGFVIHNNVSGQGVTDWVSTADNYIPDNTTTWYFYSMTYDQSLGSDNLKVKRDNANLETKTKTANSPYNGNSTYAMFLDRLPSGSGNFPANVIDEFSVWNRVLTDAEITTIYNSGTGKTLDTAKGATWTMEPTYETDFSTSTGWTFKDSAKASISGGSLSFDFEDNSGNDDSCYYDLGSTMSDTKWILRFKINWSTFDDNSRCWFGLADNTTAQNVAKDFIGLLTHKYLSDVNWESMDKSNASLDFAGENSSSTNISTGTDYYVQIRITSDTAYDIKVYSDSSYSTLVDTITGTMSANSISGLRYIMFYNRNDHDTAYNQVGTIDDLEFYNGVTTIN